MESSSFKLKPCPFCGSTNSEIVSGGLDDSKYWRVECCACHSEGPPSEDFDLMAIEFWNNRLGDLDVPND